MYNSDPRVNVLLHMFVAKCATPFWWKVLPVSEMLRREDYIGAQGVVSTDLGFTNIVSDVPRSSADEV